MVKILNHYSKHVMYVLCSTSFMFHDAEKNWKHLVWLIIYINLNQIGLTPWWTGLSPPPQHRWMSTTVNIKYCEHSIRLSRYRRYVANNPSKRAVPYWPPKYINFLRCAGLQIYATSRRDLATDHAEPGSLISLLFPVKRTHL